MARKLLMRRAGLLVCSLSPLLLALGLGLGLLGSPGCGGSAPPPTPEEIKGSRLYRLVNERVEKQIEADKHRKTKTKARGKR
jgi:hypothetical protein